MKKCSGRCTLCLTLCVVHVIHVYSSRAGSTDREDAGYTQYTHSSLGSRVASAHIKKIKMENKIRGKKMRGICVYSV